MIKYLILKAINGKKEVAMYVISIMPNEGWYSPYSFPEITCADSACTDRLKKYKTEFVDKLAALLKKYPKTYVVLILKLMFRGIRLSTWTFRSASSQRQPTTKESNTS